MVEADLSVTEQLDVWEVEPHADSQYDVALFDDHSMAIQYVKDLAESLMDELDQGETSIITISRKTMTRYDFEQCREA